MHEPVPLATIHALVLEHLRDRADVVLYGAQAVNAYVGEPRMTQDIAVMALDAEPFAREIRDLLASRLAIAVRVRTVRDGYPVYQLHKPKNRHLVDVRAVDALPPHRSIERIAVIDPIALICAKLTAMVARSKTAKGATDIADLRRLLLAFPEHKTHDGAVAGHLAAIGTTPDVIAAWRDLVAQDILPDDDDDL